MALRVNYNETATKARPGAKSSLQGQFYKTRMCPYLNKSKNGCKRKSSCCYAHSETELQKTIDLTKTKLCNKFEAENYCPNEPCQFAHGLEELRSTNHCFKTQLCRKFTQTGTCSTGDYCRHAHGPEEAEIVRKLRESGLLNRQIHLLHFGDFLESVGVERPERSKLIENRKANETPSKLSRSNDVPFRNPLQRSEPIRQLGGIDDLLMESSPFMRSSPCHSSSLTNNNSDNGSQSITSAVSGLVKQSSTIREDEGFFSNISNVISSKTPPRRDSSLITSTLLEGNGNLSVSEDGGTAKIEILFSSNPFHGVGLENENNSAATTSPQSNTNLFNNATTYGFPIPKKVQSPGYFERYSGGGGMSRDDHFFNYTNGDRDSINDSKDFSQNNSAMNINMMAQERNGKYGVPPELRSYPSASIAEQGGMALNAFDGHINPVVSPNVSQVSTPSPIRAIMSTGEALRSLGGDPLNGSDYFGNQIDLSSSPGSPFRPSPYIDYTRSMSYGNVSDYNDHFKGYPPYGNNFAIPNHQYPVTANHRNPMPPRPPTRRFDSAFFSGGTQDSCFSRSEMSLDLDSLTEKEQ